MDVKKAPMTVGAELRAIVQECVSGRVLMRELLKLRCKPRRAGLPSIHADKGLAPQKTQAAFVGDRRGLRLDLAGN
jgi:hypothetical protein